MESKERERSPPPSPIPSPISVSPPPRPRVRTELEIRSNPDDLLCAQGRYGFAYAAEAERSSRRSRTLSGFEYGAPVGEQKLPNPRGIYGFTYRAMVDARPVPRPLTPPAPVEVTRIQSDPRKRAHSSPPPERRPIEFHIKEQINYNKRVHTEEVHKLRSEITGKILNKSRPHPPELTALTFLSFYAEPTRVILPPPPPPREPTPPPLEYSTLEQHLYHELSSDTIKRFVEEPPASPPPPPEPPAVHEHRYRIETIKRYELPVNEEDGTV